MTSAFADPAKYDLYDCKQLETERKSLATRSAELQGLMAKAETGVAGPVVAELAYRNEYVAVRGQAKFAEEAWQQQPMPVAGPRSPPVAERRGSRPRVRQRGTRASGGGAFARSAVHQSNPACAKSADLPDGQITIGPVPCEKIFRFPIGKSVL